MTRCYRVEVEQSEPGVVVFSDGTRYMCDKGVLFVTTQDPSLIFLAIGASRVKKVEVIGFGYHVGTLEAISAALPPPPAKEGEG